MDGSFFENTELTQSQYIGVLNALNQVILPARLTQIENAHTKLLVKEMDSTEEVPSSSSSSSSSFSSGGGFLCGKSMTVADLVLYTFVKGLQDEEDKFCQGVSADVLNSCPKLLKIVEKVVMNV
jgi:hypothetical protein